MVKDLFGCMADATHGHQHVRERLACLVEDWPGIERAKELPALLRGSMSDDASEEDEALEFLNDCEDWYNQSAGVWGLVDGDLFYMPSDWEGWEC